MLYTFTWTNDSNVVTVTVSYTFNDTGSNDGISFEPQYTAYGNGRIFSSTTQITNLTITTFGGIPLSRAPRQFAFVAAGSFIFPNNSDAPLILPGTSFNELFFYSTNISGNCYDWNTSAVTNMSSMFASTTNFSANLSGWNTSAVTNMSNMFNGSVNFNQQIGNWDTRNVTNMSSMFNNATIFNNGDISGGITMPINWIFNYTVDQTNFSTNSGLTSENAPIFVITPI